MKRTRPSPSLAKTQQRIASEVRSLRHTRGWTLEDLAKRLDVSKSRLSDIERGNGSFTAEQFLEILALFNIPATHFAPSPRDPADQLQNALARLGAKSLYEVGDVTPSERLRSVHDAIREALIDGSPRFVTAVAPVLVRNLDQINPARLAADLAAAGYARRLGWVVDNTVDALDNLPPPLARALIVKRARAGLSQLSLVFRDLIDKSSSVEDVLDRSIRSQRTLDQVRRDRSSVSRSWNIVTTLRPDDFGDALRTSLGTD